MIRVGVDAWNLPGDRRGVGRYLRKILEQWRGDAFADRIDVTLIVPEWHTWTAADRYRREVEGEPYRVASRALHALAKLDVLWFPFNGCSWTNFSLPAVATLHDATNFFVENYQPEAQPIFHAAARRCRRLITVSNFSQRELARALAIAPDRLVPIPLGVTPPLPVAHVKTSAALGRYVLFVGTTDKRKGLDVLTAAMERVQLRHPDVTLVIAGARSDAIARLDRVRARVLGFVDDAELASLYREAEVFAFPSLYEGFGLPTLEAMSYGTPVVTTDNTSMPEVAGDAALYVPPNDPAALADAIVRVLEQPSLAEDLRRLGLARASQMTWDKTAEATLDVLEGAVMR